MLRILSQAASRFPIRNLTVVNRHIADMAETSVNVVQFECLKETVLRRKQTLIDVREPAELKDDGKIPNSINIPLGEIVEAFKLSDTAFQSKYGVSKPDFTSDFVLSCRSGKRAATALEKLKPLGYDNISVYKGSFLDWVEKGGPIEK